MNRIKVKFPARISMNLFTYPNHIVKGGYGVAIKMDNYLEIKKSDTFNVSVKSTETNVELLVTYYLEEFKKIAGMPFDVHISLELDDRFKNHMGYAFNSNIACALFFSLNKLLDDKFSEEELLKYLFASYAELDGNKIVKQDSTCMISQNCAFYGGMNIIDDLKLIYNYKFRKEYKLALISFDSKVKNNNVEELKEKKKRFIPMPISTIRELFNTKIIPELDNDNIESLKNNNLTILKGSTRILRGENYLSGNEMLDVMNQLSSYGIVGLTSSSPTIYFISKDVERLNLKNKMEYYEIDNEGITIL